MASSEDAGHHQHQHAQRPPEPAEPDGRRHRAEQDALLVDVHVAGVAREGEQAAGQRPARRTASRTQLRREKPAVVQGEGGRGRGACSWLDPEQPVLAAARIRGRCPWSCGCRQRHGRRASPPAPRPRQPDPEPALAHVQHGKNAQDQQGAAQVDDVLAGRARHLEHAGLHLLEVLSARTPSAPGRSRRR